MRHRKLFLRVVLFYGLAVAFHMISCAAPLSMETDAPTLSEVTGIPKSEIEYVCHCNFAGLWKWEEKAKFEQGVFILSSDHVTVLRGSFKTISKENEIRLRKRDIEGVDLKDWVGNRQLIFKKGDHLLVLKIMGNSQYVDKEGSQKVYDMLISDNVPPFENGRFIKRSTSGTKVFLIMP